MRQTWIQLVVLALLGLCGCDMMVGEALMPKSQVVQAPEGKMKQASTGNEAARVYVQALEDHRPDKEITRVKSGLLQQKLTVETPEEVQAFLTSALKTRLSKSGMRVVEAHDPGVSLLRGEVLRYNLDFSTGWTATVDMNLALESGNATRGYRLNKTVEKWNWLGLKSGVGALEEALQGALDQLPVEDLARQ